MEKVFISYKSDEKDFALKLHNDLEANGIDVWLDQLDIEPGVDWRSSIDKALHFCTHMVLLITPNSMNSSEVQAEWSFFWDEKKSIFPILVQEADIPYQLRLIQRIDFTKEYNNAFNRLLNAIKSNFSLSDKRKPLDELSSLPAKPYAYDGFDLESLQKVVEKFSNRMMGIRYKEKFDPRYYYARQQLSEHVSNFIASEKRIMVVTGKAGTGKSSFICGLVQSPPVNSSVWLQDCAHLDLPDEVEVNTYICATLGITSNLNIDGLVSSVNTEGQATKFLFLFDAVNEYENPQLLLRKISEFIVSSDNSNVKVILTCRTPQWNTLRRDLTVPVNLEFHTAGPNSYINVAEFESDNLREIYAKYQQTYNILTDFDDLSPSVKEFITQPLFLKLASLSYRDREIPPMLDLEDVFRRYVAHSLSKGKQIDDNSNDVFETKEYLILLRAIQLMYEIKKRELNVAILLNDESVRTAINTHENITRVYYNLISEGLLSERVDTDQDFLRQIEIVFVTYERVFEYLLANIVVAPVTVAKLEQMLKVAQNESFSQLRGASELALSLAIIKKRLPISAFTEMSYLNSPEIRQFLCDVLQTLYLSGHRDEVHTIIDKLLEDQSDSAMDVRILAMQASYQLRLDKYLLKLAMVKDDDLRNMASVFLYQRWNKARLDGNISSAYEPIYALARNINLLSPLTSRQALSALVFLTFNMLSHIIDDRESLVPLFEIWKEIADKIPGIDLSNTSPKGRLSKLIYDVTFGILSKLVAYFLKDSPIQEKYLKTLWSDPVLIRALVDCSILQDKKSIVEYKEGIKKLLSWNDPFPPAAIGQSIIWHLYNDPDTSMSVLQEIFESAEVNLFRVKYTIINSQAYAGVFRLMRGKEVSDEYFETVKLNFLDLWYTAFEIDEQSGRYRYKVEETLAADFDDSIKVFVGILSIEAFKQKNSGTVSGSKFLEEFIEHPVAEDITPASVKVLLRMVECYAYQGISEFAIYTLIKKSFMNVWKGKAKEQGITTLANIRSFFQQEVDSILLETHNEDLLNQVRGVKTIPNVEDVLFTNNTIWLLGGSIENSVVKVVGNLLWDTISVRSFEDLIKRATTTLINLLTNYDTVNIFTYRWYAAHEPDWANHEFWQIPSNIESRLPELNQYWLKATGDYIEQNGRGIFFDPQVENTSFD